MYPDGVCTCTLPYGDRVYMYPYGVCMYRDGVCTCSLPFVTVYACTVTVFVLVRYLTVTMYACTVTVFVLVRHLTVTVYTCGGKQDHLLISGCGVPAP